MNKVLNSLKNVLIFINLLCIIYFVIQNGIGSIYFLLYIIGFIVILFITLKDIRNKVNTSSRYNMLFILTELVILLLFYRTFFDQNFICNSSYYMAKLNDFIVSNNIMTDTYQMIRVYYFSQNVIYILIMYLILYLYHKIENSKDLYQTSKYSKISIILCIVNFLTTPWILLYFEEYLKISELPIYFLLFEILLLLIEIISLIIYNHKKRDYPIYICFLFNLFAFIAIFT